MPANPLTPNARILAAARSFLGLREVPGAASNPQILAMIRQAADWLEPDDSLTAWCGCFRGHLGLITSTGVPRDHFRAASWATWGRAIDVRQPALWLPGDTLVMSRPGGKHVAVLQEITASRARCIGGNQSDAVTSATFPFERIQHVRRAIS